MGWILAILALLAARAMGTTADARQTVNASVKATPLQPSPAAPADNRADTFARAKSLDWRASLPGTAYLLRGMAWLDETRTSAVSANGCVLVSTGSPATIQTTKSVPIWRADGEPSTYTLPGGWVFAGRLDLCLAPAGPPKSAIESLLGALGQVVPVVGGSLASTVIDVRVALQREAPHLRPLLALASSWTGIDFATQASALLEGAKAVGLPVRDAIDLATAPLDKLEELASIAVQKAGEMPGDTGGEA